MQFAIILLCLILGFPGSVFLEEVKNSKLSHVFEGCVNSSPIATTEVAFVDRASKLGSLYSVILDKFVKAGGSYPYDIYNKYPQDAVRLVNISSSSIKFINTDSFSDTFKKMGISSSLGFSLLSKMPWLAKPSQLITHQLTRRCFTLSVSNAPHTALECLCEHYINPNSVQMSVLYKVRTVREELMICSKDISELVKRESWDWEVFKKELATHVIVGVDYGYDAVVTIEYTNPNSFNKTEMREELKERLNCILNNALNPDGPFYNCSDFDKRKRFKFPESKPHYYIDVYGTDYYDFDTQESMINHLGRIPDIIENENNGKGFRMNYILMPLTDIINIYDIENVRALTGRRLNERITKQYFQIFQETKKTLVHLTKTEEMLSKYINWKSYLGAPEEISTKTLADLILNFKFNMKDDFGLLVRDMLFKYRKGKEDEKNLKVMIDIYKKSNYTLAEFKNYTNRLIYLFIKKAKLLEKLKNHGAKFIWDIDEFKVRFDNVQNGINYFAIISLNKNDLENCFEEIRRIVNGELKTEAEKFYIKMVDAVSRMDVFQLKFLHYTVTKSFVLGEKNSCFL